MSEEKRRKKERIENIEKRREVNNLFLTNKEVDSFLNVFLKTPSHSFFLVS